VGYGNATAAESEPVLTCNPADAYQRQQQEAERQRREQEDRDRLADNDFIRALFEMINVGVKK
jgi:hypothetical protein